MRINSIYFFFFSIALICCDKKDSYEINCQNVEVKTNIDVKFLMGQEEIIFGCPLDSLKRNLERTAKGDVWLIEEESYQNKDDGLVKVFNKTTGSFFTSTYSLIREFVFYEGVLNKVIVQLYFQPDGQANALNFLKCKGQSYFNDYNEKNQCFFINNSKYKLTFSNSSISINYDKSVLYKAILEPNS